MSFEIFNSGEDITLAAQTRTVQEILRRKRSFSGTETLNASSVGNGGSDDITPVSSDAKHFIRTIEITIQRRGLKTKIKGGGNVLVVRRTFLDLLGGSLSFQGLNFLGKFSRYHGRSRLNSFSRNGAGSH